jgi:ubiquinone/menaquinone biosynthesis C-methylase UbiE
MSDNKAAAFAATIPARYNDSFVPMYFDLYARDLVSRLSLELGDTVLELAAGTGIVTTHLVAAVPRGASLTATDLNQDKIAIAQKRIDKTDR